MSVLSIGERAPTKQQIDAGAKALREKQMAGRITRPWGELPNSDKKKWLSQAECVLLAASEVV